MTSTTTTDQLATVPLPAGAHPRLRLARRRRPGRRPLLTGGEWVVAEPNLLVQIDGTQYRDGQAVRFIRIVEGNGEALIEMSSARARELGRALLEAANEVERTTGPRTRDHVLAENLIQGAFIKGALKMLEQRDNSLCGLVRAIMTFPRDTPYANGR